MIKRGVRQIMKKIAKNDFEIKKKKAKWVSKWCRARCDGSYQSSHLDLYCLPRHFKVCSVERVNPHTQCMEIPNEDLKLCRIHLHVCLLYRKFRNFRENLIFANSLKDIFATLKIATLAWFTSNDFAILRGFYFHESFSKIKPSRKISESTVGICSNVCYK